MSKNRNDELVKRGTVKEETKKALKREFDMTWGKYYPVIEKVIDNLPAELASKAQPEEIKKKEMSKEIVLEGTIVNWFEHFPDMLEENGSLTITILNPKIKCKFYEKVKIIIRSMEEE